MYDVWNKSMRQQQEAVATNEQMGTTCLNSYTKGSVKPLHHLELPTLNPSSEHTAMGLLPTVFAWKQAPFSSVYYPATAVALYLPLIFALRHVMRAKRPLRLRAITFLHNLFLTLLSLAMGVGVLAEVIKVLFTSPRPVRDALCDISGASMGGRMGFWMYIFYLSKFYELFDTVIMVLKKRPLNFLHVYHHCIVLPLFYVYMSTSMVLQWIVVVANSSVHVAMYYYYAVSTLGHRVWWKKYITQAQIIQFIIDLTSTWPYPFLYYSSGGCSGSMRGWLFGQAVGASFFKLFCDFYFRSYRKMKQVDKVEGNEGKNVDQGEKEIDQKEKKEC